MIVRYHRDNHRGTFCMSDKLPLPLGGVRGGCEAWRAQALSPTLSQRERERKFNPKFIGHSQERMTRHSLVIFYASNCGPFSQAAFEPKERW